MPEKPKLWYMGSDTWSSLISDLTTPVAVERRSNLEHFIQDAMDGYAQLFVSTVTIVEVVRTESVGIQKWLRKSEQGDKWNRCLIEGMIVLSETGARDEQTTPA